MAESINVFREETAQKIKADLEVANTYLKVLANDWKLDSWKAIQAIGASGQADKVLAIGDKIGHTWTDVAASKSYTNYWVLSDFRNVVDSSGDTHSNVPIWQWQYCTPFGVQFDAPETEEATEETATAGLYYMGLSGTTYTKLSLAAGDAVPYSSYDKVYHNDVNFNADMVKYGYNRAKYSVVRQWLNSAAAAGEWWKKQHVGDVQPSIATQKAGFMSGFDSDFLEVVQPIQYQCYCNSVTDGSAIDVLCDKFWLPSGTEYYGSVNANEGTYFPYWQEATGFDKPKNDACDGRKIFGLDNTANAQTCWTRSAYRGLSGSVWLVTTAGNLYYYAASNSYRCAPACAIF